MKPMLKFLSLLLASAVLVPGVKAQTYPERSVRLIVPWPAGGAADAVGRAVAASLTTEFGKTLYDTADSDRIIVERLCDLSKQRDVPRAQLALAWLLHKPAVTSPIFGATKPQHVDDAVAALDVKLSDEEMRMLEEPYTPHRIAGFA